MRCELPDHQLDIEIGRVGIEKLVQGAGAHRVVDQKDRYGKTERELGDLRPAHAPEGVPPKDRDKRDSQMQRQGGIKGCRGERLVPEDHEPFAARQQSLDGEDTGGMVQQMGGDVSEQNQPGKSMHPSPKRAVPATRFRYIVRQAVRSGYPRLPVWPKSY